MSFEGTAIDELLRRGVENGSYKGVAAMVVDRNGPLYAGAAGDAGPGTMFRNASMTKAVATTAALQLVEQGRLDLDATVASILPEFGELPVLDNGELRAPASQATIRQLMTHTAGLGYFFLNEDLLAHCTAAGMPSPLEGAKAALSAPLVNDPGTMWEYGVNSDWLGLVVEAVSGQTLGAYLAEHVWGPLDMTDSTFAPTDEQRARLLPIGFRMPDGTLGPIDLDLPPAPEWESGGHGSYGTIEDYGRFLTAWLDDGGPLLDAATVDLAFEDHIEGIPMPDVMRSTVPELSNDVPSLPLPQGWGLGFHLTKIDVPGMRSAGSGDWAGIFNCFYWIDRTKGIAGVIMTQVLPFFDAKVVEGLLAFEAAVYAAVEASGRTSEPAVPTFADN